jgi:rhodanese-related sulfurtransferase
MNHCFGPASLKAQLAGRAPPVLIDVRRRAAFEADPATIPGAVWRDPDGVDRWAGEIPAGRRVVVYCVHGHAVSGDVSEALRGRGIDAAKLEGGIAGWKVALGPTTAAKGAVA